MSTDNAAAQYRSLAGIEKGHVDQTSAPEVEEFVEVSPTGQAEVVEAEADDETEDE